MPAWAIPTHHTKFTIANPQATGMFTPQIPTPLISSHETANKNIISKAKAMTKPTHQTAGARLSGISLIVLLMDS